MQLHFIKSWVATVSSFQFAQVLWDQGYDIHCPTTKSWPRPWLYSAISGLLHKCPALSWDRDLTGRVTLGLNPDLSTPRVSERSDEPPGLLSLRPGCETITSLQCWRKGTEACKSGSNVCLEKGTLGWEGSQLTTWAWRRFSWGGGVHLFSVPYFRLVCVGGSCSYSCEHHNVSVSFKLLKFVSVWNCISAHWRVWTVSRVAQGMGGEILECRAAQWGLKPITEGVMERQGGRRGD